MYYVETAEGNVTFKIKGVSPFKSTVKYTYDELVALFIKCQSIKFTDQTQFRHIPKDQGLGIIIKDILSKSYIPHTNSKRE